MLKAFIFAKLLKSKSHHRRCSTPSSHTNAFKNGIPLHLCWLTLEYAQGHYIASAYSAFLNFLKDVHSTPTCGWAECLHGLLTCHFTAWFKSRIVFYPCCLLRNSRQLYNVLYCELFCLFFYKPIEVNTSDQTSAMLYALSHSIRRHMSDGVHRCYCS